MTRFLIVFILQLLCSTYSFFQFSFWHISSASFLFHPPYMFAFSLGCSLVFFLFGYGVHRYCSLYYQRPESLLMNCSYFLLRTQPRTCQFPRGPSGGCTHI